MSQRSPFIVSHLGEDFLNIEYDEENASSSLTTKKDNKLITLHFVNEYLHFQSMSSIGTSDQKIIAFKPVSLRSATTSKPIGAEYSFEEVNIVEVRNQVYLLSIHSLGERIDRVIFDEENQEIKLECVYNNNENIYIRYSTKPIGDTKRNCIYIVGGISSDNSSQYAKDILMINLETLKWEVIGPINVYPAMYCQSSLLWKEQFIIVFGGFNTSCSATSDILAFNVDSKAWSTLYSYDYYESSDKFIIYPLFEAGMELVTNKWASQFDKTIPSNMLENTLIIYGGFMDCYVKKTEISRPSHQVFLFHLDESTWSSADCVYDKNRLPFNLTEYCTPDNRKLPPLHQREKKNPVTNSRGILLEDGDDSEEYKILPTMKNVSMHKINNTQLLTIGNNMDCYLISLVEQSIFTKFHSNSKLVKLADISIMTQTF